MSRECQNVIHYGVVLLVILSFIWFYRNRQAISKPVFRGVVGLHGIWFALWWALVYTNCGWITPR